MPTFSQKHKTTTLIPTLNEGEFIATCILSLINGDYPIEYLEIIIIDGGSTDNTIQIVTDLQKQYPQIKLLHNDKKIVPAALNLGLKQASGEIIIFLGAHAIYDKQYMTLCVETLLESNAASVGGVIEPIGRNNTGKAIAYATSSKLGNGNALYRHANKQQKVDTVFGGCFKKSSVLKIGGFNEKWVRNQDYEFNHRLRNQVGDIILNPKIKCQYFCRDSIKGLAKQYFQYGFWRFQTALKHPDSFSLRQALPLALLWGLVISFIIAPFNMALGLALPIVYFCACLLVSIKIASENKKSSYLVLLPVIFFTLHLSWAGGFTLSGLKHILKR